MLDESVELAGVANNNNRKNRFVIFYKDSILSVKLEQVSYFQMHDRHLFLITCDGRRYPLRKSMRELEEVLDPKSFFKVNRSEIIAFESIARIESFFGQRVIVHLKPEGNVIVSKSRLTKFLNWLDL